MFTAKCVRMFGSVIWPCKTVPPLGLFIFDMFDTQTMRVLVVFLVCHQEVYGAIAKHESCDESAKVGDSCHEGAGTCKATNGKLLQCVPPDCGPHPRVLNGHYENYEYLCWDVYTCADVICDDGYHFDKGDFDIQCWFRGWTTDVGANCTAYNKKNINP